MEQQHLLEETDGKEISKQKLVHKTHSHRVLTLKTEPEFLLLLLSLAFEYDIYYMTDRLKVLACQKSK